MLLTKKLFLLQKQQPDVNYNSKKYSQYAYDTHKHEHIGIKYCFITISTMTYVYVV
jgi:hypothetical protein